MRNPFPGHIEIRVEAKDASHAFDEKCVSDKGKPRPPRPVKARLSRRAAQRGASLLGAAELARRAIETGKTVDEAVEKGGKDGQTKGV